MYRILTLGGYAALMLIGGVLQAQAQLTMNAAEIGRASCRERV